MDIVDIADIADGKKCFADQTSTEQQQEQRENRLLENRSTWLFLENINNHSIIDPAKVFFALRKTCLQRNEYFAGQNIYFAEDNIFLAFSQSNHCSNYQSSQSKSWKSSKNALKNLLRLKQISKIFKTIFEFEQNLKSVFSAQKWLDH